MAPLFSKLNLEPDVHDKSLALAVKWFKRKCADTVADLRVLPSDALKELVDSLGLPSIEASDSLRADLEGEPRDANAADDGGTASASNR